jgi:GNAT superfamily N-acetyltransferase
MVKILHASLNDIPLIRSLAEETWWPTYSSILTLEQIRYILDAIYSQNELTKVMSNGSQTFLILHDDNGPQGFASFGLRPENPHVAKLHKLYVLPENQGKGYGKLLIDEVIKRVSENPVEFLDLNVNRFNTARTFYEKLGFTVIREEDVPVGPYWMNDFVMRLKLDR